MRGTPSRPSGTQLAYVAAVLALVVADLGWPGHGVLLVVYAVTLPVGLVMLVLSIPMLALEGFIGQDYYDGLSAPLAAVWLVLWGAVAVFNSLAWQAIWSGGPPSRSAR